MTPRIPEIMAARTRSQNHDRRTSENHLQAYTWAGGAHEVHASQAQGPGLAPGRPYAKGSRGIYRYGDENHPED